MAKQRVEDILRMLEQLDSAPQPYDVLSDEGEGLLSKGLGVAGSIISSKPMAVGMKILDVPRILASDIVAGGVQTGFEFFDKLFDGEPLEAMKTAVARVGDTMANLKNDIFSFDLDTSFDGSDTLKAYFDLFDANPVESSKWLTVSRRS